MIRNPIYHCNISQGIIGLDVLRQRWVAPVPIRVVLSGIYSLLAEPDTGT